MAEIIENQTEVAAPTPQQTELANAMAFALGTQPATQEAAPVVTEPEVIVDTPPAFSFDVLKERFGYTAPEEVATEIEQLRQLKANPPAATYEFENEESKKLFEAFTGGKRKEVVAILAKQERIEELLSVDVTNDNAAEIVKYGMQLRYKDLSPSEIDYKFKKQFSIPPKPVQTADEDDDDFQSKVSAWQEKVEDARMDLMIEAKTARPEIEAAKIKLVLPEIDQPVDEGYLNYKKSVEDESKLAAETVKAYKALTPKSIETKLNFNDEANGIAFDFQFEPDAVSFNQAVEMTTDIDKFYSQFQNQDGTPDRNKFLKTIYNAMNFDRVLTEAMKQAKNATIKSMLPDNSQGGLVRQMPAAPGEMSDLDKYMRTAGIIK